MVTGKPARKVRMVKQSGIFAPKHCKENAVGTKYYAGAKKIKRAGVVSTQSKKSYYSNQ